ncbi:DNA replication regulator SLD3-domain-containing protein [Podospora appendiculata]|uniref:DNA replication regulator SLD3-domain-containing protein n=1 Tax=Podospora appendiculata TaxID=314037 RepID=A0AAE0XJB9_9PEZI|nr:DNA replication regulator SLD3-domain-containing protein [Podospora appendiculata]
MSFRNSGASRPSSSAAVPTPNPIPILNPIQSVNHSQNHSQNRPGSIGIRDSSNSSRSSSNNRHDTDAPAPSDSRKRKRESNSLPTDDLLKAPVVLKPYPSSLAVKPRILHPLMLLPREHLPLSTLDLAHPQGDFPDSRLFESHIKILDLEGRLGSNVLLARSETSRMIYAIELEGNGLYVLCKLGGWVDVEILARSATVVCNQRIKPSKPTTKPANPGFPPLITPQMHKDSKKKRLAIEEIQFMVRKRSATVTGTGKEPQSRPLTPTEVGLPGDQTDELPGEPAVEKSATPQIVPGSEDSLQMPGADPLAPPDAEAIFQSIRAQYLETLYHSMGSLAYFAKGPLSRARAAFHLDYDSNLEMSDLIDFLRSLILPKEHLNKKYQATVPEIVEKMKTHVEDSDHRESKPSKRKPKKPKLGKDGLYPSEVAHIRQWWLMHKPPGLDDDEKTLALSQTKYHISCLKRRETQLQMILILEILALEILRPPVDAGEDSQLPGMESQATPVRESQEKATRKKSRTNLPGLLELYADKLCIWQSTTEDEVKALADSQIRPEGHVSQKADRGNSDPLRDFCVDIIVPFFSARLPELCDSLNRKLGGPVIQAPPPKERFSKPALPTKSMPGAPVKRPSALRNDKERTLERVLSNERMRRSISRGPSGAIALLRSASTTTIPGLKREGSEPLLAMIPRKDIGAVKDKAAYLFSRSTSFGGAEDIKAKKKAIVEAELKNAITALKKPNRTLANRELVEAAEKRASVGMPPVKKLKKPTRAVPTVQVKATPANNRFKDVLGGETQLTDEAHDSLPFNSSIVPASSAPRRFSNIFAATASPLTFNIQATPTRNAPGAALQAPVQETPRFPPSSPIIARKAVAKPGQQLSVPAISRSGSRGCMDMPSSPGLAGLFETPLNTRASKDNMMVLNDTPIKSRLPAEGGMTKPGNKGNIASMSEGADRKDSTNIYQRLGWDTGDDFDELDDLAS